MTNRETTRVSLRDLIATHKITMLTEQGGARLPWDQRDPWQRNAHDYRITVKRGRTRISFDYWQGTGITDDPELSQVLDSLLSDAQAGEQTFEDFCQEFGSDPDSRKAEKTWNACRAMTTKLRRLLGAEYETFLYAERE